MLVLMVLHLLGETPIAIEISASECVRIQAAFEAKALIEIETDHGRRTVLGVRCDTIEESQI